MPGGTSSTGPRPGSTSQAREAELRTRGTLIGVALFVAAMVAAPAASAAPANIVAGNGFFDQYNPTTYSHDGGTIATMTWAGGSGSHDVTANSPAPGGGP